VADDGSKARLTAATHVLDTKWLWVVVFAFAATEWAILFSPNILDSFSFIRQLPEAVSCPDWPKPKTAYLNLKAWIVVSLSQAVIWGAVTFASVRWLIGLWREGEAAGRSRRPSRRAFRLWTVVRP
jgi:hypothetical protein